MGFLECCSSGNSYETVGIEKLNFRFGDILFFGGHASFTSILISLATWSRITHVGIVIEYVDENGEETLGLLESGRTYHDNLVDWLTKKRRTSGVRLVNLKARLQTTSTSIYVRKSNKAVHTNIRHKACAYQFAVQMKGVPYEKSRISMLNSAWHFKKPRTDLSTLFCSEIVAQVLMEMHEMDETMSSSYYTPASLSTVELERYSDVERVA